jgi:dihydropteroate synthase
LRCGPHTLPLGAKTYIMGILNLTPDSFSGDGLAGCAEDALRQAERMLEDGADLLDVGGESTRPGSEAVPEEEELARVLPVVRALAARFAVPISVDTYKSEVARQAVEAGATLINDISGLHFDPHMAAVAAAAGVPVVVMHIKDTPRTMQANPHYDDLMTEIAHYLQEATRLAEAAGIPRDQVVLDPGFGFGKTVAHNLEILRRLRELTSFGQPILLGTSRKSTIGRILGDLPPEERMEGTAATVALGIAQGADIMRVHDVRAMARVARMTDAIVRGE